MTWTGGIKTHLLCLSLGLTLSGCYFSKELRLMNADRYEIDPRRVIAKSDGALAVESDLIRKSGKQTERIPGYAYGSPDDVARTLHLSNKKGVMGVLINALLTVRALEVEVEPPKNKGWHLFTTDPRVPFAVSSGNVEKPHSEGQAHEIGESFEHPIGGKRYRIQIDRVSLDKSISRVKKDRTTLAQKLLFLPAIILDVVSAPVFFVYDIIYHEV